MSTLTLSKLTGIAYVTDSVTALFTNPAATTSYVRLIVLYNGNATSENIKVYNVPNNGGAVGTAGTANAFENLTLVANDTALLEFSGPGLVLTDQNDSIQGSATLASGVTIQIMGAQEA